MKEGTFIALRNNEISAPLQGRGLDETVVASVARHTGGTPLRILDIERVR